MESSEIPVIIAGAGPVGLSLALALARHGVRSVVLEKEPAPHPYSRALGILTRTLEIFRCWEVLDAFLAEGEFKTALPVYRAGKSAPEAVVLDFNRLSRLTATPGLLILPQNRTEAILLRCVRETGQVDVRFGHAVQGFREEAAGVVVQVAPDGQAPYELRGAYLAGCDGAHSVVREQLGWHLDGTTYPARVARAAIALPFVQEAVTMRAAMLDTRCRQSVLLRGAGRWLGKRAPDGDLVDAEGVNRRLLDLVTRDAALLLFDDGRRAHWNPSEIEAALAHVPHLQVVPIRRHDRSLPHRQREPGGYWDADGSVWQAWSATGDTAALVRPDGFVGWRARGPSPAALRAGVEGALGLEPGAASPHG